MNQTEQNGNTGAGPDPQMERIHDDLLQGNETITALAVARKHPAIGHTSCFIHHSQFTRSELLTRYQERQKQYREWQGRAPKRSRDQLGAQLAQKDT